MEGKIGKFITFRLEVKGGRGSGVDGWNIEEKYSAIPYQAVVVSENAEACKIVGTSEKHTFDIKLEFNDNEKKVMRFLQANNTVSQITDGIKAFMSVVKSEDKMKSAVNMITPKVYDENDNVVGVFDEELITNGEGNKEYSLIFDYYDKKYYIYKTPTEDRKTFAYAIYENEKLVAEILNDKRKGLSLDQELLKFDIYAENNESFKVACLFVAFWSRFRGTKDVEQTHSRFYEELSSKFSQPFIDNIKSNINPAFLIENMPLCEELDRKARHYGPRLASKIIMYILLVVMAIIFISMLLGK